MLLCSCIIHVFRIALARSVLYRLLMRYLPAAPFLIHFRIALCSKQIKIIIALKISLRFHCVSDSKHWMCAYCNKVIVDCCHDACNYMQLVLRMVKLMFWPSGLFQFKMKYTCLWRGGNRRSRRKTSLSRVTNQHQTWPTYGIEAGNPSRATVMGGECYHLYAIPARLDFYEHNKGIYQWFDCRLKRVFKSSDHKFNSNSRNFQGYFSEKVPVNWNHQP